MTEKGAISGNQINEKHKSKRDRIHQQWAKQAAEGAIAILDPSLEIRWKKREQ